ncbi:Protein of unknown function DUF3716 [Penicillium sp. IBT 16267x]|nr:Protein of unknown function DUF3716 [Penicillium sp. IBT 16267x]
MELGENRNIPPIKTGTAVLRPGRWATFMLKTEFTVAVVSTTFKSELIRALRGLPAQQELVIRWGRHVILTGHALFQRISSELANVEAATIQVVGQVQYGLNQCKHCQRNEGPFAHCVKVDGNDACGNCHYQRNGHRRSFSAVVAPDRRRKRITVPFAEFNHLVEQMRAVLARAKVLKGEVRGIEDKCAGAAEWNPEADSEPNHPNLANRMQDYFRFLRFVLATFAHGCAQ